MFGALFRKSTYQIFLKQFSYVRSTTMESGDEFYHSLTNSQQKLKESIRKKGVAERDLAISEYCASLNHPSIPDFPKGLEWFNVSEPLSFQQHLKGKIVLLDFFTYCCINCMHILPDLKDIENEFSTQDGLVVIGVHSAKFDNEKNSKNILAAVQRHNISHPVVNDNQSFMWKNCDINCWPSLLLLGPNANPIVLLTGEGHRDDLLLYIKSALSFYKSQISHHQIPFESAYHLLPDLKGPLLFPGKITNYFNRENDVELLAISDTGNNRILILENNGRLIQQIGGSAGFKDGKLEEAQFNAPQGVVFQNRNVIFVADTENHAIREIDLLNNSVKTIAGVGEQGNDHKGGKQGVNQEISSPWDLCLVKTKFLGENVDKSVLLIAMAGTHQIWGLFLENTKWWKDQEFTAGTCVCIAGSGREENRNNQYPHAAAFAQPSGFAFCSKSLDVFIADSESSSIRRLSLIDGKVSAVVGGDRNPNNLFAFGDQDGKLHAAKLQHLLGLAISKDEEVLFVADTYNHKIKKVDVATNTITTMDASSKFNEPAGLCTSADGRKLYVTDTNNHDIKVLELSHDYNILNVNKLELKLNNSKPCSRKLDKSKYQIMRKPGILINSNGGKVILKINVLLANDLALTADTPQKWVVDLPNASWSCVPMQGSNVLDVDVVLSVPPKEVENTVIDFVFDIITCGSNVCVPKSFIIQQPIDFGSSGSSSLSNTITATIS